MMQEVTKVEYRLRLSSIGINVNARNFIIFQGQIESIAAMTSVERAKMIEELSGLEKNI